MKWGLIQMGNEGNRMIVRFNNMGVDSVLTGNFIRNFD